MFITMDIHRRRQDFEGVEALREENMRNYFCVELTKFT